MAPSCGVLAIALLLFAVGPMCLETTAAVFFTCEENVREGQILSCNLDYAGVALDDFEIRFYHSGEDGLNKTIIADQRKYDICTRTSSDFIHAILVVYSTTQADAGTYSYMVNGTSNVIHGSLAEKTTIRAECEGCSQNDTTTAKRSTGTDAPPLYAPPQDDQQTPGVYIACAFLAVGLLLTIGYVVYLKRRIRQLTRGPGVAKYDLTTNRDVTCKTTPSEVGADSAEPLTK